MSGFLQTKRPCVLLKAHGLFVCRMLVSGRLALSGKRVQLFREAGLFLRAAVFLWTKPLVTALSSFFAGSDQSIFSSFHVATCCSRFKSFYSSTKCGFVRCVAQTALFTHFHAFDSGFNVWHDVHLLQQLANKQSSYLLTTLDILTWAVSKCNRTSGR